MLCTTFSFWLPKSDRELLRNSTWTQHPPLNVSWNGVAPTGIEEGGFEKVRAPDGSEKFYLIGGGGGPARDAYSMWADRKSVV